MRQSALALLIATLLVACSESQPPADTAQKTTPAAPAADAAKAPPAAPAPATAQAPKEVPEGDCGDQGKVPEDQRVANTARWSTASEQNSFSFDVYRGDTEKGEFAKITKMPLMGAGTTVELSGGDQDAELRELRDGRPAVGSVGAARRPQVERRLAVVDGEARTLECGAQRGAAGGVPLVLLATVSVIGHEHEYRSLHRWNEPPPAL